MFLALSVINRYQVRTSEGRETGWEETIAILLATKDANLD